MTAEIKASPWLDTDGFDGAADLTASTSAAAFVLRSCVPDRCGVSPLMTLVIRRAQSFAISRIWPIVGTAAGGGGGGGIDVAPLLREARISLTSAAADGEDEELDGDGIDDDGVYELVAGLYGCLLAVVDVVEAAAAAAAALIDGVDADGFRGDLFEYVEEA